MPKTRRTNHGNGQYTEVTTHHTEMILTLVYILVTLGIVFWIQWNVGFNYALAFFVLSVAFGGYRLGRKNSREDIQLGANTARDLLADSAATTQWSLTQTSARMAAMENRLDAKQRSLDAQQNALDNQRRTINGQSRRLTG